MECIFYSFFAKVRLFQFHHLMLLLCLLRILLCYKKIPVIFVGNFCAGQGKNTEILRVCSSLSCVKNAPKCHFLQKFPVFPCFSLFLPVSFVSWTQVFHKPKVKGFLHRQENQTPNMGVLFLCRNRGPNPVKPR